MKTDTKRLCELLYGYNYAVSLFDFRDDRPMDTPLAQVMATLLPTADLGNCVQVAPSDAISEVETCINYLGNDDHGPLKDKIESREFSDLRASLFEEITELSNRSSEVFSFYFKAGHPAYPVFWEFSFAFRRPDVTRVIIGSSSD